MAKKYSEIVNLDGEEWKDIVGYEGYYQISNFGRVKSLGTRFINRPSIILNPAISKWNGYRQVSLFKDKKLASPSIHYLVITHFVSPKPKKEGYRVEINHIDTNKLNNHYKNLEWSTTPDNMIKRFQHKPRATAKIRDVYQIDASTKRTIATHKSYRAAAKTVNIPVSCANKYFARAVKTGELMRGYIWRRYTKEEIELRRTNQAV